LIPYTENELLSLWDEISEQSMSRQQWIKDLDDALEKLEKGRMDDVSNTGLNKITAKILVVWNRGFIHTVCILHTF